MCEGHAPKLEEKTSFVGRWMDILRPGYERIKDIENEEERIRALEQQAVIVSLENLMTFPFVRDAISDGNLTVHGLWHDIGEGEVEHYSAQDNKFVPV
jgi:carbonic anhydrase